jgi:hypothetical protein
LVLGKLIELHPKITFNEETWSGVGRVLANSGLRKTAFYIIEEGGVTLLLMRRALACLEILIDHKTNSPLRIG